VNCKQRRLEQKNVQTLVTLYCLNHSLCRCNSKLVLQAISILAMSVRNSLVYRILPALIHMYINIHTNVVCVTNLSVGRVNTAYTCVYILDNIHTNVTSVKNSLLGRIISQYICVFIEENVHMPVICVKKSFSRQRNLNKHVYVLENVHILVVFVRKPLIVQVI